MMPSRRVAFPLIRHLRFHALPKMVLDRDFVDVKDELGLIKVVAPQEQQEQSSRLSLGTSRTAPISLLR